jgi:hypothetical protein
MKYAGMALQAARLGGTIGAPIGLYAAGRHFGHKAGVASVSGDRLHDQLLMEVQANNPGLSANQAQYEAARLYAQVANKPEDWVDGYMMDVGADQGDAWGHIQHASNRHGRQFVDRNLELDPPQTEGGHIYLGGGQWEPGAAWDGTRSLRNW